MNTRMYYGRSVDDQAKEQTIPGHVNAEPRNLMDGISTVNLQQQHHNFMPHQMNFDPRHLYYGHPPQYGGNEFLSVAGDINDTSVRVRSGSAGVNFIHPTHYSGYIEGGHDVQSLQPVGPFPFCQVIAGNPVLGLVGWNHPPAMPYMHCHRDHNLHQVSQMQGMSDHCFQFFPQVPAPHFPLANEAFNIPMANPIGPRLHRSSRQIAVGTNRPQIRALPEAIRLHCDRPYLTYVDEVAVVDLQEHYNVRHHSDDHSGMRMDTENMSYEELLALGEHIGNVNTGLSEERISNQLRTTLYKLPSTYGEAEDGQSVDGGTTSCIICLGDYENQEEIGYLNCGHDYHVGCLKKWLLVKNFCPICKTQALPS